MTSLVAWRLTYYAKNQAQMMSLSSIVAEGAPQSKTIEGGRFQEL